MYVVYLQYVIYYTNLTQCDTPLILTPYLEQYQLNIILLPLLCYPNEHFQKVPQQKSYMHSLSPPPHTHTHTHTHTETQQAQPHCGLPQPEFTILMVLVDPYKSHSFSLFSTCNWLVKSSFLGPNIVFTQIQDDPNCSLQFYGIHLHAHQLGFYIT